MSLIMLLLLASTFTVFAVELENFPPSFPHPPPPHPHSPPPPSPFHPPLHAPPSHYHHHHHLPAHAPFHPPPPHVQFKPHVPLPPPHYTVRPREPPFPRPLLQVQGVVYVKSCKYASFDTLTGGSPVLGSSQLQSFFFLLEK